VTIGYTFDVGLNDAVQISFRKSITRWAFPMDRSMSLMAGVPSSDPKNSAYSRGPGEVRG
jgi:hypothetical protein